MKKTQAHLGTDPANKSALENLYRRQSASLLSRKIARLPTPGSGTKIRIRA
jgi:hypothetical protein